MLSCTKSTVFSCSTNWIKVCAVQFTVKLLTCSELPKVPIHKNQTYPAVLLCDGIMELAILSQSFYIYNVPIISLFYIEEKFLVWRASWGSYLSMCTKVTKVFDHSLEKNLFKQQENSGSVWKSECIFIQLGNLKCLCAQTIIGRWMIINYC